MLGHRELSIQDYWGILKRRSWLILGCAGGFLGVGVGLTFVIPPKYQSQTLVIVQQQRVPEDYVKPVVSEDLNARLASMKEQILSRSRLEPIIDRYDLFNGQSRTMDERVEETRKAILVKPIASGTNKMPGFYISFRGPSARVSQQVCSDITSLFVSESLKAREQTAEGTTEFLSQQLADAKRGLDDQDSKLATFQRKYIGRLPGQEQSNLNTLQSLTTQLDAATQSLNRLEQDETFVSAMIAQQTSQLQQAETPSGVPTDALEKELKALIDQKKALDAQYTSDHPDVVAISRRIAELQKEIARNSNQRTAPVSESVPDTPQLQQERAQLRGIRQSIASAKQEQKRLTDTVRTYQGRIESSPAVEEEYKQVTRDHETALQFYNNLLSKMNESSMATNLERRQQGEQFQVLDAANLPDQPSFPNPFIFSGGGLALGLAIGLLLTALLEYRDTSLKSEKDIYAFTGLPTVAVISYIEALATEAPKRHTWWPIGRKQETLEA